LKETTGSGKEKAAQAVQTAKAERSGDGSPRRRRVQNTPSGTGQAGQPGRKAGVGALPGVDFPGWERRRGEKPQGRRNGNAGAPPSSWSEAGTGVAEGEVLEGERKARSGIQGGRETNHPGGSTEDARAQAERLERGEGGVSKPNERLRRAVRR
jgi:hypothetical protein